MHNKTGHMAGHLLCMSETGTECNVLAGTPQQVTYSMCKIVGSNSSVGEDSLFAVCVAVSLSVFLPTF
jgi:hypothetical protein